jgi:hypothetical protein
MAKRCSGTCKKHCGGGPKRSARRKHSARRNHSRTQRHRGGAMSALNPQELQGKVYGLT